MATLVTLDELSLHFSSTINKTDTKTNEVAKHRHKLHRLNYRYCSGRLP